MKPYFGFHRPFSALVRSLTPHSATSMIALGHPNGGAQQTIAEKSRADRILRLSGRVAADHHNRRVEPLKEKFSEVISRLLLLIY